MQRENTVDKQKGCILIGCIFQWYGINTCISIKKPIFGYKNNCWNKKIWAILFRTTSEITPLTHLQASAKPERVQQWRTERVTCFFPLTKRFDEIIFKRGTKRNQVTTTNLQQQQVERGRQTSQRRLQYRCQSLLLLFTT